MLQIKPSARPGNSPGLLPRLFLAFLSLSVVFGLIGFLPAKYRLTNAAGVAFAAADPVIAAAGDIACDPASSHFNGGNGTASLCRQKYTSDLLLAMNPAAVLPLGDIQYYCGGYQAFLQSYDPSWGRLKNITRPAVGNHEYLTSGGTDCVPENAGASGYFNYFGAAAGQPGQGYYSYDIGAWHLVALNSNCTDAGGCNPSSPQGKWLKDDLAAHKNYCTLAYWHIPLFSSGGRAEPNSRDLWQILYDNDVDVVLNGHDHIYERFAPQAPDGTLDLVRGIRQFTVGTGGANLTDLPLLAANSEVRNADTYGVLKLTLHPTSYDWEFVPDASGTFTDAGTGECHGDPSTIITPTGATSTRTPTATLKNPILFTDGFETGDLSRWGTRKGLVVQDRQVISGHFAASGVSAGGEPTYVRKSLSPARYELYYHLRFILNSQGANPVNLMKLRSSSGPVLSLGMNSLGQLSYRNDVTGTSVNGMVGVPRGAWQTLQVHVRISGPASLIEVWHNGVPLAALTRTESFGTDPITLHQLGENTAGLTYDLAFDDVVVSANFIENVSIPTSTPTRTPTPSKTPPPTKTPTPTMTPTNAGGAIFADVPAGHWARPFIETLFESGITGGCGTSPLVYCPTAPVTRAQMAVFLLRAKHGRSYSPPAAAGNVFGDVPAGYWAAGWIERLAAEGITGGCGGGAYCPDAPVTRDQMAVFLLRARYGRNFAPPPASGTLFVDVPAGHWAAGWIERLAAEGITGGCGGGAYCPAQAVTRDQMAVFLVRTFNLP